MPLSVLLASNLLSSLQGITGSGRQKFYCRLSKSLDKVKTAILLVPEFPDIQMTRRFVPDLVRSSIHSGLSNSEKFWRMAQRLKRSDAGCCWRSISYLCSTEKSRCHDYRWTQPATEQGGNPRCIAESRHGPSTISSLGPWLRRLELGGLEKVSINARLTQRANPLATCPEVPSDWLSGLYRAGMRRQTLLPLLKAIQDRLDKKN